MKVPHAGPSSFQAQPRKAIRYHNKARQAEDQGEHRPTEEGDPHKDAEDHGDTEAQARDMQADESEPVHRTIHGSALERTFMRMTGVVKGTAVRVPIELQSVVVSFSPDGIAKFLIGLMYRMEQGHCLWRRVPVRMATLDPFAIRLLDLLGRCGPQHPKHPVVIKAKGLVHQSSDGSYRSFKRMYAIPVRIVS